ncbi:MAG: hypothetical protein MI746_05505 [Pseudomonadales bacterium]|nr:hypothetical protein [Pseudomonadales bacterium]
MTTIRSIPLSLPAVHRLARCTALCWLLNPIHTLATTILSMEIDAIVNEAELIFEGKVISHQTQLESGTGIINTYVTFSVVDVIQGDFDTDILELKFTGGEHEGQIVKVSGLRIPSIDEEGIYFVESLSRDLINPLLGWSQGHFVISEEAGERRVNTADEKPVTDIQAMSSVPEAIKKPRELIEGNSETAAGVVTEFSALTIERAMTVEQFKSRIVELLGN